MIIGIILVAVGMIFTFSAAKENKKGEEKIRILVAFTASALLIVGGCFIAAELIEGVPKGTISKENILPPENLPLVIKMVHVENNFCYMTTAPYNDQSALKQPYYQIPIEHIEDLGNIEAGTMVINDNGVLRPHDKK